MGSRTIYRTKERMTQKVNVVLSAVPPLEQKDSTVDFFFPSLQFLGCIPHEFEPNQCKSVKPALYVHVCSLWVPTFGPLCKWETILAFLSCRGFWVAATAVDVP